MRCRLTPGSIAADAFDLSHNTGLRSIRLTLDVPETAIDWATTILASISPQNTALVSVGLEFYVDPKRISEWGALDALFMHPALSALQQVEIGLFAYPNQADFIAVKEEMRGLDARGVVRWYQLGVKSHKSNPGLTPRISQYEA